MREIIGLLWWAVKVALLGYYIGVIIFFLIIIKLIYAGAALLAGL